MYCDKKVSSVYTYLALIISTFVYVLFAQVALAETSISSNEPSNETIEWKTFKHSKDKYSVKYPSVDISGKPDKAGSSQLEAFGFMGSLSFQRHGGWADIYRYDGSLNEAITAWKLIDSSNRNILLTSSTTLGDKNGVVISWRNRLSQSSNTNKSYLIEYPAGRTLLISGSDEFVSTLKFTGKNTTHSKTKKKVTTIEITKPKESETIDIGNPIKIQWKYKNAPINTQVIYSVSLVKSISTSNYTHSSGGQGGTMEKLKKNGSGGKSWKTGVGYLDTPGTYRIDASIRDCHPDGCHMNAQFPGLNLPIRTYASATPVTIVVREKGVSDNTSTGVKIVTPKGGQYRIGDKMNIVWENNDLPKGSKVCAFIQNTSNKKFVFTDDNDYCISSILMQKINTFSGTLIRTPGYALVPGKYRIFLEVTTPTGTIVSAGKEGGGDRKAVVSEWFDIL